MDRAHCTAVAALESVERMPAEKSDSFSLSCQARIAHVFDGDIKTNELLRFTVTSKKELPLYTTGTNYIVYLRHSPEDKTSQHDASRWETALGEEGIQDVAQKRLEIMEKVAKGHVQFREFLAYKEDLTSLSPVERKMASIIIPEVDFRCAHINDIIECFNDMSRAYDKSPVADDARGVTIVNKLPPRADIPLIHYYTENASLLKNMQVLAWFSGCEYVVTNGMVEIRGKTDLKLLPEEPEPSQE